MPADSPIAASVPEPFPFSDAAGCRSWLARLPLANPAQCHALLSTHTRRLPATAIGPAAKLEILELLREPVAATQDSMASHCRGKPVPLDARDNEAWQGVVALWQAMAAGYDSLIDAMAGTAPDLATHAHFICQRALRYTAAAMFEHCHIHHVVSSKLWQQLHRLYAFSENAGLSATTVNDAIGRRAAATSCAGTYLHALLMHSAQPDSLSGEQLDLVDRWLESWESLVVLSPSPPPQSSSSAIAVDLASRQGAGLARQMSADSVRHLNVESLSKTLRQTTAALRRKTPAQLGLGDFPREACEKLLLLLHIQWCAAATGRADERAPASIKVRISPTIASMHYHLTGKAFRQPDSELTAAARQRLDMFGSVSEAGEQALASQRSVALETWVIVNQSISGFLGTARKQEIVNRISHHQLVALQPPAKKVMYIGIVQRLNVDEADTIWIGLRIILGAPQAVAVRIVEGTAGKYDRGLLMPEDTARKIPATILLQPGWFQANRLLGLLASKERERRIRLLALLDQGPNFERVTYTAA